MQNSPPSQAYRSNWFSITAGGAALGLTIAVSLATPHLARPDPIALAIWALLLVVSGDLVLEISGGSLTLTNVLAVAGLLIFGPAPALWLVILGEAGSDLMRTLLAEPLGAPRRTARRTFIIAATNVALQVFSLSVGWLAYGLIGGRVPLTDFSTSSTLRLAALFVSYFIANELLFSVNLKIEKGEPISRSLWQDWQIVILFDLLPLPLSIVIANVYNNLGLWSFAGLSAFLLASMIGVHILNRAQMAAEQRVRELTSLAAISQATRSTLDVPELLETIHQQISRLMDANNFYVALYDEVTSYIAFPLVYENGAPVHRAGRQFANGMTELIIRTGRPYLIRENVTETLRQLGVDSIGPPAESWLGVPVTSEGNVLGVMAVQHPVHRREYDEGHLSLLTTIAAQAALALRNAQLYSATRQRAMELAILNSVSTTLSASLDLKQVARVIVESIRPVIGCQKSAFFLLNDSRTHLDLFESRGLTEVYVQSARHLPVGPHERGMVAYTHKPIVIPDIHADSNMADFRPLADAEGFRALAEVPLIAQNEVTGTLVVYYAQPHQFSQAELDLLNTFANQAAAAVANARLYARTDQALARRVEELSAIEEIGRELITTLDARRIIDRLLEQAMEVTGAHHGVVVLFDVALEEARLLAHRGYPYPVIAPLTNQPWPLSMGITGRVLRTGRSVNIPDVHADPDYYQAMLEVQSQLSVPIVREEQVLGVITLESDAPAAFDNQAVSFTEHLGNQAAIALSNARLYEEAQRRLREISILYEASQQLTGILELGPLTNKIVERAGKAIGSTSCLLVFWDRRTDMLQVVAGYTAAAGRPIEETRYYAPARAGDYPATLRLLQTREPLIVYADDPQADPNERRRLKESQQNAVLDLPLVAGDNVIGLIEWLDDRPRRFSGDELRLAQTLANQAAIVVENSRLFQRVAEGRDRLQAILNSSSQGILMLDLGGRVVMVNPMLESLWQAPRQALEGQRLEDLINRPALKIADKLGLAASGLDPLKQLQQKIRDVHQLPAPSLRFVERTTTPVLDPDDKLVGWMLTLRDVTEERELQQMRDELTSMIVHDLRSPLGAILSGLTMIRDIVAGSPEADFAQEVIQVSERSTRKLLTLVDSLLDISKGRLQLSVSVVHLPTLVKNVLDTLAPLATENGIILSAQLPPTLPPVEIDEEKIGRVLTNLLDNALKFTPAGRQVTVLAKVVESETRSCVRCAVRDAGPGIPAEYVERIFDRFVQVPGQVGRRRGTGLGLAFCKLAVEAHGERIWVESTEGQGSTFYFTLPIHRAG